MQFQSSLDSLCSNNFNRLQLHIQLGFTCW